MSGGLAAYILRRLLGAMTSLGIIVAASFFMMRLAPGGPFDLARPVPPEIRANLERAYGLDRPVAEQFTRYVRGLLHGDFGASYRYQDKSVTDLIRDGAPVSALLGALSLSLATVLGVTLGAIAAYARGRWIDHVVMTLSLAGVMLPGFALAPLLVIVFSVTLRWLPVAGWSETDPRFWVLPVIALTLPMVAVIARLMRASLLDVLGSNFARTARAKGLSEREVLLHHCLRPALMPILSFLGPATAGILTGSVVVETIFALPGIGRYFIQGALNRDYTLVMGVVVFYAVLIISCNFLVDLLYGYLDPKLRFE